MCSKYYLELRKRIWFLIWAVSRHSEGVGTLWSSEWIVRVRWVLDSWREFNELWSRWRSGKLRCIWCRLGSWWKVEVQKVYRCRSIITCLQLSSRRFGLNNRDRRWSGSCLRKRSWYHFWNVCALSWRRNLNFFLLRASDWLWLWFWLGPWKYMLWPFRRSLNRSRMNNGRLWRRTLHFNFIRTY